MNLRPPTPLSPVFYYDVFWCLTSATDADLSLQHVLQFRGPALTHHTHCSLNMTLTILRKVWVEEEMKIIDSFSPSIFLPVRTEWGPGQDHTFPLIRDAYRRCGIPNPYLADHVGGGLPSMVHFSKMKYFHIVENIIWGIRVTFLCLILCMWASLLTRATLERDLKIHKFLVLSWRVATPANQF